MNNKKISFKPLLCSAILATSFATPTYFYANDSVVEEMNESVEEVEKVSISPVESAAEEILTSSEEVSTSTEEIETPSMPETIQPSETPTNADLNAVKDHTKRAINLDLFGDSIIKNKYVALIDKAQSVEEVNAIFEDFTKLKNAAEKAKLDEIIEKAINKARTIPGFLLVEGHDAIIELIQNASSAQEVENHLADLKSKADAALALNAKREELSKQIRLNYRYLGNRIGDYNLLVEQYKSDQELQTLRQQAEDEHKPIVANLIKEAAKRIQQKVAEINSLPELDASNPMYKNQRTAWTFATQQIPLATEKSGKTKQFNNAELLNLYETDLLFLEIYANIEYISRKSVVYANEFPNSNELATKVNELIYADGIPYTSIDGAQEVPKDGDLRTFYKTDILPKFQAIEQLYSQLKQSKQDDSSSMAPAPKPQPEKPSDSSSMAPEAKPQPEKPSDSSSMAPETKPQPEKPSDSSSMAPEAKPQPEKPSDSSSMVPEAKPQPEKPSDSSSMAPEAKPQPESKKESSSPTKETKNNQQKELVKTGEGPSFMHAFGALALLVSNMLWIGRKNKKNNEF